ncbi:peptide-methionine (S)-S-oxide reductase [Flavobacterium lipolyticum]|uniref:peptide-methionine (S)-S-oxide reductase n=1 Tax=Flavobacterium lipolyticum TaxID=2893754 RepID=A0ABS8M490_9FLAO|nr:peptide-methionine (S)-S-oxide reductase [Flavobacterium sp. F-126]MCC9019489.1 peptide-methionine (S)-S-oxide reductase [Flavobacterium sp. F-126]
MNTIGFGGGCHWCIEAVFDFFKGVTNVRQGWIKSEAPDDTFSEAVLVDFDSRIIPLEVLIEAHLITHSSTSNHSMREKYRSAIYFFDNNEAAQISEILQKLDHKLDRKHITKILPFTAFKSNEEQFLHYYETRKEAPFCQTTIVPKLKKLQEEFEKHKKSS